MGYPNLFIRSIAVNTDHVKHGRFRAGFTLIELIVTLAILAVLASTTVPLAQVAVQRGKEQELRIALREIRRGLDDYKKASDEGRIARASGSSGFPANLKVLVEGVVDQRDPRRIKMYFLRRIPFDPTSTQKGADADATWGLRSYASEASDPQAGDDIYDIYSTSNVVGLNGVPYRKW